MDLPATDSTLDGRSRDVAVDAPVPDSTPRDATLDAPVPDSTRDSSRPRDATVDALVPDSTLDCHTWQAPQPAPDAAAPDGAKDGGATDGGGQATCTLPPTPFPQCGANYQPPPTVPPAWCGGGTATRRGCILHIVPRVPWLFTGGSGFMGGGDGIVGITNGALKGTAYIPYPSFPGYLWIVDIWGASATDVFAVGRLGQAAHALHNDGTTWKPMPNVTGKPLSAVWGRSASDVYAVGGSGVLHYDGKRWCGASASNVGALKAIWGTASHIFAAGERGVMRHDGSGWVAMPGAPAGLRKLGGTAANNVYGVTLDALWRYDGRAWSKALCAGPGDTFIDLYVGAANRVYVGGRGYDYCGCFDGMPDCYYYGLVWLFDGTRVVGRSRSIRGGGVFAIGGSSACSLAFLDNSCDVFTVL